MTRIVAIHGFLGRAQDWATIEAEIKKQSPQCDFMAVDLNSNAWVKAKSPKDWAKKFNQNQKNKHVERNILMGYSMGGRLALHAAIDKPGLWDEVVMISSNPGLFNEVDAESRLQADAAWAQKFAEAQWSDVMREWNIQDVFRNSQEPARLESDYDRQNLAHMLKDWSLAHHDIQEDALLQIKHKLHWYVGENDAKYLQIFKNLHTLGFIEDVKVVPEASHRVVFDNPTEFTRQLVADLKI